MRHRIPIILLFIALFVALGGFFTIIYGICKPSLGIILGGAAAIFHAVVIYGYAYIVEASALYCDKFFAEHSKEGQEGDSE